MSMILVVDAITISYRPWSAIRPGKARPHPRLLELSQTASRLVSTQEFRRKSNSYLKLFSQGEAIEVYILNPFTPNLLKSGRGLAQGANSRINGTMTR